MTDTNQLEISLSPPSNSIPNSLNNVPISSSVTPSVPPQPVTSSPLNSIPDTTTSAM